MSRYLKSAQEFTFVIKDFNDILFPLNDKENDVLLPFATIPYIEHIIEVVFSAGIKKIVFILKSYGDAVKYYINQNHKNLESKFEFLIKEDLNSVGDCLRYLNSKDIILTIKQKSHDEK